MRTMKIGDRVHIKQWDADGTIVAPACNYDWEVRSDDTGPTYTRDRLAPWNESELIPAPVPKSTPKLGEVWVGQFGTSFACTDDIPDDRGLYGWSYLDTAGRVHKAYYNLHGKTPPKVEVPPWLKSAPWVAVYGTGSDYDNGFNHDSKYGVSASETLSRYGLCIGALNVLTGEWVPR